LVTVGLAALALVAVCSGHRMAESRNFEQLTLRSLWLRLALESVSPVF